MDQPLRGESATAGGSARSTPFSAAGQPGSFSLDGRQYEVRGSFWGNRSTMVDEMGGVLAAPTGWAASGGP